MEQLLKQLDALDSKLFSLNYSQSMIHWDAATVAPKKSVEGRAHALVDLSKFYYELFITEDNRVLIDTLYEKRDQLDATSKGKVKYFKDMYESMSCIPADEYAAYSGTLAKASKAWEEAKEKSDFSIFAPHLEKVIEFQHKYVAYRKKDGHPYDTLLNDYERGLTVEVADAFFIKLREAIVPLVKKIQEKNRSFTSPFEGKSFSIEGQKEVSNNLVDALTLDPDATLIAESVHPFTMGIAHGDTRITTHYYENDILSSIYSTIHEGGHAIYDQNIDAALGFSLLADGTSMGIHESQSRFYENNVGRSKSFWDTHFSMIQKVFPEQLKDATPYDCYLGVNDSKPSLIRIEADELTYALHVMVRYEIEKQIMEGSLEVKDLPKVWNDLYEEYLGLRPANDAEGVLQDVHWSEGLFGYFPSYALGSAYAAQFAVAMKKDIDFEGAIASNNLGQIKSWLTERIHKYGAIKTPAELIEIATGESFNPDYFINYLVDKYTTIYDL